MHTAWLRFFTVPELASLIGSRLSKQSIVKLMTVSRTLNHIFTPILYKTLDLTHEHKSLPESPDAFLALARNINFVKSISFPGTFCSLYVNGHLALQDLHSMSYGGAYYRPPWLPRPTRSGLVIPIPCMVFLTNLHINSPQASQITFYNGEYLAHVCYILQLSPGIITLRLDDIPIQDSEDVVLLAMAISRLGFLQTLALRLRVFRRNLDGVVPTLFFSCPKFLRVLDLSVFPKKASTITALRTYPRIFDAPLLIRREPLRYLTRWVGQNRNPCHISAVAPMIEHCPALTDLEMPLVKDLEDIYELTDHIIKKCPKLCRIMQGSTDIGKFSSFDYDREGAMSTKMMNCMLENTLVEFVFRQIQSPEIRMVRALQRHSESLTRIALTDCELLQSRTIQQILSSCSALEEFVVLGGSHALYSYVPLYKIVEEPWASTRFRKLDLAIDIGEMEERLSTIYSRPAPIVLTEVEKERFEHLERLYRQIGALVDLEDLSLRVALDWYEMALDEVEREVDYHCFTFPGMLTLGNPKKGWPGYLRLLSGLTKLRRLAGSVNVVTDETKLTVGWREVVFLEQTFPKLEVAEFLPECIQHPPCFQWLQEQCPGLQMSYVDKK